MHFPPLMDSSLLVQIAHHVAPHRLPHLRCVLDTVAGYPFRRIDVVIDTNVDDPGLGALAERAIGACRIRRHVHRDLEDPHRLTWQHRRHMGEACERYDYFMYLEDDMEVPAPAVERWWIDAQQLDPVGCLRGFIRVETTADGTVVCTDQKRPIRRTSARRIGDTDYLPLPNPYCAFWIYSRSQFERFRAMPSWDPRNNWQFDTREAAACGMFAERRGDRRTLVPLDDDGTVCDQALVVHLANNYAGDPASRFGSLPVTQLVAPHRRLGRTLDHARRILRIG